MSRKKGIENAKELGFPVNDSNRIDWTGFRIDEKDGKIVCFSAFPEYDIENNGILQTRDGEYTVYFRPVEFSNKIMEKEASERFLDKEIEIRNLQDGQIRRDGIMLVIHHPSENHSHLLYFVRRMESHLHQGELKSFHINARGESENYIEEGGCEKCRKYFESLNHLEICFEEGMLEMYKFPDWYATYEKIREELETTGFYEDFDIGRL